MFANITVRLDSSHICTIVNILFAPLYVLFVQVAMVGDAQPAMRIGSNGVMFYSPLVFCYVAKKVFGH